MVMGSPAVPARDAARTRDAAPPRDAARTRARILSAARRRFADLGYDRCTVRAIATDAGVSPNLITRYFGGKYGLFQAATEADLQVEAVLQGPVNRLGTRLAAHIVARWETGSGDDPLLTMIRTAMSHPIAAEHMAEFYRTQALVPITRYLGRPDSAQRAAAASAFIMGTVIQRYVLKVGPISEATTADFRSWLGQCLQALLTEAAITGQTMSVRPRADAS